MAEYYRTHFTIESTCTEPDVRGMDLMSRVESTVREWASRRRGDDFQETEDGGWECEDGASLIFDKGEDDTAGFCRLLLQHPHGENEAVTWQSDFRLATIGEGVDVEVEVRRIDEGEESSDIHIPASRPKVLVQLFQRFRCSFDGSRLTTEAQEISEDDSDQFVSGQLTDSNRRIPIVVVAKNDLGGIFMSPDQLQSRLIGLAKVYTYDKPVAWSITQQIGSRLGCWNGAIRIYRPGCTLQDGSNQNRFWTWARMNYILWSSNRRWDPLLTEISDECQRHSLPQAGRRLYDEVSLQVSLAQSRRLVEMIKQTAPDEDESAKDELLNEAASKIVGYQRQDAEQRHRITTLESEIEILRKTVEQLNVTLSYQEAEDPEPDVQDADPEPEFSSVYDVVNYAEEKLPGIRFFSLARERAKGSQFQRYNEVYEAFLALNECAAERSQDSLRKSVKEWLSDRGIDYSPHESKSTMGKYGDKRMFHDEITKDRVEMQEHVKLGGGLGEHNQLRIHMKWEPEEGRWLVGYIGRHLKTVTG